MKLKNFDLSKFNDFEVNQIDEIKNNKNYKNYYIINNE